MLSINKDDCLTCAIAEAKNISYKVVYYSVKLLGTVVNNNDAEYMGMKSISKLRAIFSNKPMVLIYKTSKEEGHAVAIINRMCVDNKPSSYLENRSVLWLIRNCDVIIILKAKG